MSSRFFHKLFIIFVLIFSSVSNCIARTVAVYEGRFIISLQPAPSAACNQSLVPDHDILNIYSGNLVSIREITSSQNPADYLPWTWKVAPNPHATTVRKCPSAKATLGTFAAVNAIAAVLSVLCGHRILVKKLTFGILGRKNSNSWVVLWVIPFGLNMGINVLIAALIKWTSGYEHGFAIWQLALFYCARPRFGWFVLLLVAGFNTKSYAVLSEHMLSREGTDEVLSAPAENSGSQAQRTAIPFHDLTFKERVDREIHYVSNWGSSALASAVAEVILTMCGAATMILITHFGVSRGFYHSGSIHGSIASNARMMYAGALYYCLGFVVQCIYQCYFLYQAFRLRGIIPPKKTFLIGLWMRHPKYLYMAQGLCLGPWVGAWLFWAGYVKLSGDLYCPPSLFTQAALWVSASALGVLLGVGP